TAPPFRLEAHAVDGAVHFGYAENLFDAFADGASLCEIDRLATEGARMREAFFVEVGHDYDRGTQQQGGRGGGETHGAGARNQYGGTGRDTGRNTAMKACGQNIRQAG